MKNASRRIIQHCSILATVLLFGCATDPVVVDALAVVGPVVAPEPPPPVVVPVEMSVVNDASVLKEGIGLYNNGDYANAVTRLNSAPEIWVNGSQASQLEALKYIAFSHCVSSHKTACRKDFERALKLNPDFDLTPGEKGHPIWGPIFTKVQKRAQKAH
jgi:hypothetical protein